MRIRGQEIWSGARAAAFLMLMTAPCLAPTTASGADPPVGRSTHFAVPGKSYRLLMPPEHMRKDIARLMREGRAPRYLKLGQSELRRRCPGTSRILGCTKSLKNLKVIYISNLLKGEELQMVLIHEFAHYLYDWKH